MRSGARSAKARLFYGRVQPAAVLAAAVALGPGCAESGVAAPLPEARPTLSGASGAAANPANGVSEVTQSDSERGVSETTIPEIAPVVSGMGEPPPPPAEEQPSSEPPPAGTPALRFIGRVDTSDPAGPRFAWSGTGVIANFFGTSVGVRLSGGQEYTVLIDGLLQPTLLSTGGLDTLGTGLESGAHSVEIYRRTEADQGEAQLLGFDFGAGELLAPPPRSERRIELIGDSISCGYGNEGANMDCMFTPDTENHYLTFGAIAAREFGAELSTVAWSGKGVVCNYGDDASSCTNPMPSYYDRILPTRADSRWDFSTWQPQAVVVNLGTNDFSTLSDPSQQDFVAAYVALLGRIRTAYPEAQILCTVGPLLGGTDLSAARTYIDQAVQQRNQAGDAAVTTFQLAETDPANGYGCAWHPSLRTHEVMAEALIGALRTQMGW